MMALNQVVLAGNLTRDGELRYAKSGTAVLKCGLAVSTKYGDIDETVFIDVTCFGKAAEIASEQAVKGAQVLVHGRLQLEQWAAQDGAKRSKISVVAPLLQFPGTRPPREEAGGGVSTSASAVLARGTETRSVPRMTPTKAAEDDEDIPF